MAGIERKGQSSEAPLVLWVCFGDVHHLLTLSLLKPLPAPESPCHHYKRANWEAEKFSSPFPLPQRLLHLPPCDPINQSLAGAGEQESTVMGHAVRGSWRSGLYRLGTTLMTTGTQTQDPKTDTVVPAHKHVATQNTKRTRNFHKKVHLRPGCPSGAWGM